MYLHTGDFRASLAMEGYPELQNLKVHSLYLDTTYCDPQYDFPAQEEVISLAVRLVTEALASNPNTLIACGAYTIGKERIFTGYLRRLSLNKSFSLAALGILYLAIYQLTDLFEPHFLTITFDPLK